MTAFPGINWVVLAEPVPQGSIHWLKMKRGTIIPVHTHPVDEIVEAYALGDISQRKLARNFLLTISSTCQRWKK